MRVAGRSAASIAESIETQLASGAAGPGDALPTVRDLSRKLKVSPATVAAAYRLLRSRGLARGSGRRGTRVATRLSPAAPVPLAIADGTVDLASGNPDPALLPPLEPALRTLHGGHVLYGATSEPLLPFAAAEFEADEIPARATAVVGGALDGIERILREHARAGDYVGVEDPSFRGVGDLVYACGCVPTPIALDEHGPAPETMEQALRQGCRVIIVTPRAQNPTGAAITRERAADLRRLLRRWPDVVLIENDYMAPVAGAAFSALRTGPRERWTVVRSTSKFLGPDLRVALMAGDELTISRVRARQALGARWVSHLLQQVVLSLWSDPSSGRRLARAMEIYSQRRRALQAALAGHGIAIRAHSGFNVWIPVSDEARVVHALADRGWAVAAGEPFRIRSAPAVRVTASTLEPPDAVRFAADLAQTLRFSTSTLV
jgi:DNA-binding transcriptional MocR family regulator